MSNPKENTMPTMPMPPMPPVIPGNGPEIAGSPWLTDPEHPLHPDHPANAAPVVP